MHNRTAEYIRLRRGDHTRETLRWAVIHRLVSRQGVGSHRMEVGYVVALTWQRTKQEAVVIIHVDVE
jgi:hypothetical protein